MAVTWKDWFRPARWRDKWRAWHGVQVTRALPAAGPMPTRGDYIARDDVRVPVTDDMTPELWRWLTHRGWRTIHLANDRRRYRAGMPSAIEELAFAETEGQRERLERHVLETAAMSDYELKRKAAPPRRDAA